MGFPEAMVAMGSTLAQEVYAKCYKPNKFHLEDLLRTVEEMSLLEHTLLYLETALSRGCISLNAFDLARAITVYNLMDDTDVIRNHFLKE